MHVRTLAWFAQSALYDAFIKSCCTWLSVIPESLAGLADRCAVNNVLCWVQIIIIDEITSLEDVQVVQSMVAGGIRVIAGASACTSLASLLASPHLSSVVQGLPSMTSSGNSAATRGRANR